MEFNTRTINKLLNISDSYQAPRKMLEIMLNKEDREELFEAFLAISSDLSYDWFQEYFEEEQAQRKSKKQDFTPKELGTLLNKLVGVKAESTTQYYEPAAGTGGLVIAKWNEDRANDPTVFHGKEHSEILSFFTYDPRNYLYWAEELSDRAIPFLLFNLSIRGVNAAVVQCDVLERTAKDVYCIRNNTSNFMAFSEIVKLPHTQEVETQFNIKFEDR